MELVRSLLHRRLGLAAESSPIKSALVNAAPVALGLGELTTAASLIADSPRELSSADAASFSPEGPLIADR